MKTGSPRAAGSPSPAAVSPNYLVAGIVAVAVPVIPIIMGMPPHMIIMGMPIFIMLFIMSQRSRIMSIMDALAGFIFMVMPSCAISQET